MNTIDYNCDVFFKYAFGRNTTDSQTMRTFMLQNFISIDLDNYDVDNPELIPESIKDKTVILDIYMRKSFVEIDMEMQKSHLSRYLHRRFLHYSSKLVASQLAPGETAHDLKDVIQIIFVEDIDRRHPCLVDYYHAKQHQGDLALPHYIQTTIYVYLPYIEEISKKKEKLTEFEALIYLIHTNTLEGIDYEEEKGVIQIMERLHSSFVQNQSLMEATMVRYQQKENFQLWHDMDVEDARNEGIEYGHKKGVEQGRKEGVEQGRKEGIEIATIDYTKELIYLKYHIDDLEWINQCNEKQINKIKQLMLKDMTYEELKKEINKHT